MTADNSNQGAPPPASKSSEITADLVHGASAAATMAPPVVTTRPVLPMPPALVASPFGSPEGAMAMSRDLSAQIAAEMAIAADGMKQLMQSRTPIEFFMTQSRLMSEFYGRLMKRSVDMTKAMPGIAKPPPRLTF